MQYLQYIGAAIDGAIDIMLMWATSLLVHKGHHLAKERLPHECGVH